jgi:putative ABC transport system ATP-binding protein
MTRDAEIVLTATGIRVDYGVGPIAVRALAGVSLDVRRSEILMLMGPSGSGKTTLLQVLGLLINPNEGEVWVKSRRAPAGGGSLAGELRRREFGFVFQAYNLFPTLTARENVELALDIRGFSRAVAKREAASLLGQVGLASKLDSYPAQLSGGQKQRVAIARALTGDSMILLADEPTAALDSVAGQQVMHLLRELASSGRAVVMVTHDDRVTSFADRIISLRDGQICTVTKDGVHG